MNLQYRPVRREERGMFILHHLIDVYALSFLTLVSDGRLQWPSREIPGPLLLKSDVNLFNHLVRKADVAGCCSAGSVLRWHEVAPYSVSLICIVWSCFYVKLMQINYHDTCVIIDYLTWFDGLHARCDMQMIIIITLRVLSGEKKGTKKNIVVSSEP